MLRVVSRRTVFGRVLLELFDEVAPVLGRGDRCIRICEGLGNIRDLGEEDFVAGNLSLEMCDFLLSNLAFLVDIPLLPPNQRFLVDIGVTFNVGVVRELKLIPL